QQRFGLDAPLGALDEASAENAGVVAVVGIEYAGLAWSYAGLSLGQSHPGCRVAMLQRGGARGPRRAHLGENLHSARGDCGTRRLAQPVHVPQIDLVRFKCLARTHHYPGMLRIEVDYVKRLSRSHADAPALTNRVAQYSFVTAQHAAIYMHDVAGIGRRRPQLGDDVGISALWHEADVLAVMLFRHCQAHLRRNGPHARLWQVAERKAQVVDLFLRGREQEVTLIAISIDWPVKRPVGAVCLGANVMAGGKRVGTKLACGGQKVGKLDGLIAGNTGDRRLADSIAFREGIDHGLAEALLVIEHIVRDAQSFRDPARVID